MKIGIIATSLWRSVHLDMAKALQLQGNQVSVYTEDARMPTVASLTRLVEDDVEILGIHHERRNPWLWLPDKLLKPVLGRRFFTTLYAIHRYLRQTRCDVYMVEGDWIGVFVALLGYITPFRWAVATHDPDHMGVLLNYPGEPRKKALEITKRWVLRSADAVRVNSFVTRDILVKGGVPAESVTVIPLHYTSRMIIEGNLEDYRSSARVDVLARHQLPADTELLVVACRLTPIKGLDLAVRALGVMRQHRPQARLLICGGDRQVPGLGSYRAWLEKVASECGASGGVMFAGNINPGDVKRYYAAANLHLVTSYVDTFNYSAVEAALAGTRSIMTDMVGCGHWLAQAGGAVLVHGRDPGKFGSAISDALASPFGTLEACQVARRTEELLRPKTLAGELEALLSRTSLQGGAC